MICDNCIRNLTATYSTGEKEIHCIYGVMLCSDLIECSHFSPKPKPPMSKELKAKAKDSLSKGKEPRKDSQRQYRKSYDKAFNRKASRKKVSTHPW